jgi:hypothetical protein
MAAADWCVVSDISFGSGDSDRGQVYIELDIKSNLTSEQRVALVTVSKDGRSEVVTITQEAGDATISIDDHTMVYLDYTGGTYSISVTSNASWTAAVESAATWCTLTTASGKSNGAIIISAQEAIFRRYTTVTVSVGMSRDSVIVFQHGVPNNSAGVEIDGITWAIRNVDDFGVFAPLSPQDPAQLFGKFYQFNRPVAYTSIDPLSPEWNDTKPEGWDWSLFNDPCPEGWRVPSIGEYQKLAASGWRWVTAEESEYGIPGAWFGPGAQDEYHPMVPTNAVFFPAAGARDISDGHIMTANDKFSLWKENIGCYWPNEDDRFGFAAPPMLFTAEYVITSKGWGWNKIVAMSIRCVKK